MSSPVSLTDLGHGRAIVRLDDLSGPFDGEGLEELTDTVGRVVDAAFADRDMRAMIWVAPKGDWRSRRIAWALGFTLDGTVRSGLPVGGQLRDAWIGTLVPDDPREPREPWLEAVVLEGEGLRLRPFGPQDVPRIVEASADPESQRWLGQLPSPYTESDALAYLEAIEERHATNSGITWAVVDGGAAARAADDRVLASIGIFDYTPQVECEIGYWTHPDARGHGVASRAMALATSWLFGELGVNRVKAYAAVDNIASRRVIERCGYRHTGVERLGARVREGREDMALYDLLASELTERSAAAATASTANPASESATPTTSGER